MAISYPVDVANTLWAVLRVSSGEIISRNKAWPEGDGAAIPGLDPDYVYLLQTSDTAPDYDSRTHTLVALENVDVPGNELRISYSTNQRSLSERVIAVDNEEMIQADRHVDLTRQVLELSIAVAILIDVQEGLTLPPRKQAIFDRTKAKGLKLFRNRIRAIQIKDDEAADLGPDHDAGWEDE